MNLKNLVLLIIGTLFFSCQEQPTEETQSAPNVEFQNKGHELVYKMTQKVGDYQKLLDKKDVVYTYTYTTPDSKADISIEKYIFDGELSYAAYQQHERTLPEMEGLIEQGYDGHTYWCKHNGKSVEDKEVMNRAIFSRGTNFYWFAMFQKLLDPGLNYEYIKQETVDGHLYDIVKISFNTNEGEASDIYQLYINQKTSLVDQFLFTVDYFNVSEPFLMKVEYEEVEGVLIPTKRAYTKANWEGETLNENWIQVRWTDIKFNNGLSKKAFEL
ncbi:MAG: hypothetical protein DHS20C18_55510 [Saprospiraceae bacterium]|nr:MAG: hypothetical protein DHS20C18_55510 [Saprospiraceae bacterium]